MGIVLGWLGRSALMMSPAGGFIRGAGALFGKVPKQVWLVLLGALLLWLGIRWHTHQIHELEKTYYKQGYDQAVKDINAAEAKKVAPLKDAKVVAEAKIDAGDEGVRKNVADQNHRVDVNVADLLSMWSPHNKAAGGDSAHTVDDVSQANGAGSAQPADARADDGLAAGPQVDAQGEPTITVPAKQLIVRAGICDRDYIALKAWEQTYANYMDAYNEWASKVGKVKPAD